MTVSKTKAIQKTRSCGPDTASSARTKSSSLIEFDNWMSSYRSAASAERDPLTQKTQDATWKCVCLGLPGECAGLQV